MAASRHACRGGKGTLFKYLGGVDAFPICLSTKDPEEIIQAVKWIEPTFGGINLEDFSSPKCFYILEKLRKEMPIPVWHDDQQGTAAVILAATFNALKYVGKKSHRQDCIVGAAQPTHAHSTFLSPLAHPRTS
jgi:malate dehydrogenase (oxaloacetate-decarboxylating)